MSCSQDELIVRVERPHHRNDVNQQRLVSPPNPECVAPVARHRFKLRRGDSLERYGGEDSGDVLNGVHLLLPYGKDILHQLHIHLRRERPVAVAEAEGASGVDGDGQVRERVGLQRARDGVLEEEVVEHRRVAALGLRLRVVQHHVRYPHVIDLGVGEGRDEMRLRVLAVPFRSEPHGGLRDRRFAPVELVHDVAAPHHPPVQLEGVDVEARHDPKVPATAAESPKEIRVRVYVHVHDVTGSEDHFVVHYVVTRPSVLAGEE